MSRTEVTPLAIRQSHDGSVVHVDFRNRRPGGADRLTKLALLVMTREGVPIALGIAWLIIMFAAIAFANEHDQKSSAANVAAFRARAHPVPAEPGCALDSLFVACPDRKTGIHFSETCSSDASHGAVSQLDLASRPSLASIDGQTDIKVFLQSGVPIELHRAALRRAWRMDPAIRDFRGLQENDWDFNDPNSIPGFGEIAVVVDRASADSRQRSASRDFAR